MILIHLTNKSMTDGMEKVTKIRIEKIEEIIKRIKGFNLNLKKFREKDMKSEDNKDNIDGEEENKYQEGSKIMDSNGERGKKKEESSLVNSSGFNTDYQKYIPLTILNYSFFYSIYIIIIIIASLIPIYYLTLQMVNNTNQLIIVQNYIFGKLIETSTSTIEIKCFMSECKNLTDDLNYTGLVNMDLIQEVIKGVNVFPEISVFYNEKFLLDACAASFKELQDG